MPWRFIPSSSTQPDRQYAVDRGQESVVHQRRQNQLRFVDLQARQSRVEWNPIKEAEWKQHRQREGYRYVKVQGKDQVKAARLLLDLGAAAALDG